MPDDIDQLLDLLRSRIARLQAELADARATTRAARPDLAAPKAAPLVGENGHLDGIKETAEWTGLSVSWWYAAVAAKRVPHFKVGKYVKFRRAEIEAWLKSQHQRPSG